MIGILIPVHNEEALLGDCLKAALIAAAHPGLLSEAVTILVVLDSCSDGSAAIAQAYPVQCLEAQARNVGHVRGVGARHLLNQGARWISCTDADSRVAPDWLVAQLALGVDAVCGTVTVDAWSEDFDPAAQIRYHQGYEARDGHRHIHGANLGVSAGAYIRAGGFD
ncbi:glycosyltransferase, partial [Pseudomonas syringae]|uniref:glycosyltransferase n=2 Tax=Pseudomonas TaxID=286 RepID=UPI001F368C7E